jgi:hypothetical protein
MRPQARSDLVKTQIDSNRRYSWICRGVPTPMGVVFPARAVRETNMGRDMRPRPIICQEGRYRESPFPAVPLAAGGWDCFCAAL